MTSPFAIVTGTSAGIGEAVARALLASDWDVVGIARRPSALEHPGYRHVTFDLSRIVDDAAGLEQTLAPLLGQQGQRRIGLVNNAAAAEGLMPVANLEPSMLARTHAVNVIAPKDDRCGSMACCKKPASPSPMIASRARRS